MCGQTSAFEEMAAHERKGPSHWTDFLYTVQTREAHQDLGTEVGSVGDKLRLGSGRKLADCACLTLPSPAKGLSPLLRLQ